MKTLCVSLPQECPSWAKLALAKIRVRTSSFTMEMQKNLFLFFVTSLDLRQYNNTKIYK